MTPEQSSLLSLIEQRQKLLSDYAVLQEEYVNKSQVINNVRSLLYKIEGAIEYLEEKGITIPEQ